MDADTILYNSVKERANEYTQEVDAFIRDNNRSAIEAMMPKIQQLDDDSRRIVQYWSITMLRQLGLLMRLKKEYTETGAGRASSSSH
jgi:hypothetical protein